VIYGDGKGKLEAVAQIARAIRLLEPVAEVTADLTAWPAPFTLEMQSCGFITPRGTRRPASLHYVTN